MMFWLVPEDKKEENPFIQSVKNQKLWLARVYTKNKRENWLFQFDFCIFKRLLINISAFHL